jgi:cell division protein FtsI/penicillin-binding protein 2
MANVAATIARGGVWVRPKLLRQNFGIGAQGEVPPTTQAADRVDLGIPPEALAAVREGMFRVVHSPAGSGGEARRADVAVAGKTGTAEAAWIKVKERDPETGKVLVDEKGKPLMKLLELSSHDAPNSAAPWYRATGRQGDKPHHSWFMGYAPAEKPQIAFAVMVEYGGSGGGAAGSVASKIVELCIAHKYLKLTPKGTPVAAASGAGATSSRSTEPVAAAVLVPAAEVELLHDVPATTQSAR